MKNNNTVQRTLPVKLTDVEVIRLAKELSKNNQDWAEVELEKKSTNADFQARINRFKSEIEVVGLKISTGVEHRSVDCRYEFNAPKKGLKTLTRVDTNEIVREEKLTTEDVQMLLDLKKKEEKKTSKKAKKEEAKPDK